MEKYNKLLRNITELIEKGLFSSKGLKKELLFKAGFVSAYFLIFYSILRIFSEIFREPDIHLGLIFNYFSMGTLLSLLTIIIGLFIVLFLKKNESNN